MYRRLTTRAVEQTVAGLDGVVDGVSGAGAVDLPEAEADLGHVIAAVELDVGDGHFGLCMCCWGRSRRNVETEYRAVEKVRERDAAEGECG